jgi:hypothetical protein
VSTQVPAQLPALDTFLARVEPFNDMWPAVNVRYSAVLQDREWRNLFTRVTFTWDRTPPSSQGLMILRESFRAGRLWLPMPDGLEWVRSIRSGRPMIDGAVVRLDHVNGNDPGSTTRYGWTEFQLGRGGELNHLKQVDKETHQGYLLMGNGGMAWELLKHEDWVNLRDSLLGLPQPYGGLEEFSTEYLGFSEPRTVNHPVAFEIMAPFDVTFQDWSIKEGRSLEGHVTYPPTVPEDRLTVAGMLTGFDGTDRRRTPITKTREGGPSELVQAAFSLPFHDQQEIRLHLLLRNHNVDTWHALIPAPGSPNPRFQALFGLGRIGDQLAETLAQPDAVRDSHRLELVVCWLLHLCGFQVMPTDLPTLTGADVADVVAYDPYSNEGLVVEVTGKDPLSNEKLTKLRRRTDDLASHVPSIRFVPVAAAVARDTFLQTEVDVARGLSVALLGRPQLQRLLTVAQENRLPSETIRREILGLERPHLSRDISRS